MHKENGSFILPHFHPFFGRTINLFLGIWFTLKGYVSMLFSCTEDKREPCTQEPHDIAMSAILHQTLLAL